ncbi:NUDIX hydrolase [Arsenicicoccus sp. oral taxon 190]|uniref:NUDIX hydrolase n=1 Tax=Arsenicicoccus sp. oral taxon 190 TaxID=1658671 RepID=UPI00067E0896|nr:NUDIX hydrolase [Arsenicicoccus sp. oral taxon 190]
MTRDDWQRTSPPSEQLGWDTLWADERHGGWQVEAATRETDGWTRTNLRLQLGDEDRRLTGAACVCVRRDGDAPRVLLVDQQRPAPGVRLWEIPRGMVDPDDATPAQAALRELGEETGLVAELEAELGEIYPDTGVFAGSVAVVLAGFVREGGGSDDAEPEVEATRWFTRAQVRELIATGRLRDGISLGALALADVWREAAAVSAAPSA